MRYLPLTDANRAEMLSAVGVKDINALFADVPESALLKTLVDLPAHMGEMEVEQAFGAMAAKNLSPSTSPCFIGGGAYRHHIPATVDYMIQRGEFLTAYTPYQPEVSQGMLQVLFEFQTQVAMLTGMEVANASMYDGATGTAEAVMMAGRITRRNRAVLAGGLHPHYAEVTQTHAKFLDFDVVQATPNARGDNLDDLISQIDDTTSCVVVQTPDVFGNLHDLNKIAAAAHEKGALLVAVNTEVMSLGLIEAPGNQGADIVVCEGQSLGNPLGFGGPYVGLFATHSKYVRQMPGRVCGETEDVEGRRGWVLTLSTREQHIRREKATSNICTNSGLCALAFSIHASLLGEEGLKRVARTNHATACALADRLGTIDGVEVLNETFFNEFTVKLSKSGADVVEALAAKGILGGIPLSRLFPGSADFENLMIIAATETNSGDDIDALCAAMAEVA